MDVALTFAVLFMMLIASSLLPHYLDAAEKHAADSTLESHRWMRF